MCIMSGVDAIPVPSIGQYGTQLISVVSPMVGGVGVGFFGCLLSYQKHVKNSLGKHTVRTRCLQAVATIGSFTFSLFSLLPLVLGAPVNVVNVVRAGSLLPSNAIFSQLLGLRPLHRDDYVGTLVTISSVTCFILFVGPPGPERTQEEYLSQITRPAPVIFNIVLLTLFFGSAGCLLAGWRSHRRLPSSVITWAVSVVISCSIAAMDIATKGWAAAIHSQAHPGGWFESVVFWACFLTQACFFVVGKWGMIYGCSHCDVLVFVPLNIVLNIFFAVAAGFIVLGEASQVPSAKNWFGLTASWLCVVAGIFMLVTGPVPEEYHLTVSLKQEHPDADTQCGSDDVSEEHTDTMDADSEDGAAADRTNSGLSTQVSPTRGLFPAYWLCISQTSALARLNRAHIMGADVRRWCRDHLSGHIRQRHHRHLFCHRRSRFTPEPESPDSSAGSDSDSSETPA